MSTPIPIGIIPHGGPGKVGLNAPPVRRSSEMPMIDCGAELRARQEIT